MRDERITIRVTDDEKKEINLISDKYKMNISQFVYTAVREKLETEKLSESQERFISLFDVAYKKSSDPNFKQLMVVLNRVEFNTRWLLKQQDIFMQHLKVPQTKDELHLSIIDHPITEVAHEEILKDIRNKKKADATSVDENDLLKDYLLFANNDSCLYEDKECFTWSMNGDIDAKRDLIEINKLDSKGTLWSLVISFPPDFAINNGLITKQDYFQLTKNIIPTLLSEMGLKLNNVSWYCSLHRNTNNPHLHINFYEHHKTISDPRIPYSCIHNLKSNIANYLIDNEKFYRLRDQEFTKITGDVNLKELTKIKNQKLFGDKYRKELNSKLVDFYSILPKTGRLQYNSKNMKLYKNELDDIIKYILMHDSVKYNYSKYLRLLDEHQKELTAIYGESSSNKNKNYYENQLNKLYSKIGNEILFN